MWLRRWVVFLFILVFFIPCYSAQTVPEPVIVLTPGDDYRSILQKALPETFLLTRLDYESDVYFQQTEFNYLVGLTQGTLVTQADIAKAVSYLFKKNIFESITLSLQPHQDGMHLHIKFVGFWTFKKLRIESMSLGKDRYRQYYLIEPGEKFDERKHQLSLEKMKEALQQEGYCAAKLTSRLMYDHQTKSVEVRVKLNKGDRFSVGKVGLEIKEKQCVSDDDIERVRTLAYTSLFKGLPGSWYSKKQLTKVAKDLTGLLSKQGFVRTNLVLDEHVDTDAHKVDITFSVDLMSKKEFVFVGNQQVSDQILFDRILLFGRSAWMLPAQILQQEIEQVYQEQGFCSVAIESQESCDKITFIITEGPRIKLTQVDLHGVTAFASAALIKKYFARLLKPKHLFNRSEVDKALEAMLDFYISEGFLDVQVRDKKYVPRVTDATDYILDLTLHEGMCVHIAGITCDEPFQEVLTQGPFAACVPGSQVPFTLRLLEEQRRWLLDHCHKLGYLNAKVKPDCQRDGANMHIAWKIDMGSSKTVFGKTVVLGSSTFPFEYIQREFVHHEGNIWDKESLKQSLGKLRALEIFDTLHFYPYDGATQEEEKAVLLKLQEDDRYEVRTRAGFAFQQLNKHLHYAGITYRLGGTFLMKNPFNYGDLFSIDTDVTMSQRTFSVNYRLPWLWHVPVRTLIQGYANMFQYPGCIGVHKPNIYQVNQDGLLCGLSRQYDEGLLGLNLGIEVLKTSIREESRTVSSVLADKVAVAIDFEPQLLNKRIPYFQVEPTFMFNGLDNRLQPTMGYFGLISCKAMLPLDRRAAHAYFMRFFTEQSFFIPVSQVVFGVRLRCGYIFHKKFRHIAPPERFYLGGPNSIRSYDRDRCPPLGVVHDEDGQKHLVPRGGKAMINLNLEARFPLYRNLGGVVFQDLGALAGDDLLAGLKAHGILAATGLGARYQTPIGAVRFDIGWKWHRDDPSQKRYAWFLTLGNAF